MTVEKQVSDEGQQEKAEKYWLQGSRLCTGATPSPVPPPHTLISGFPPGRYTSAHQVHWKMIWKSDSSNSFGWGADDWQPHPAHHWGERGGGGEWAGAEYCSSATWLDRLWVTTVAPQWRHWFSGYFSFFLWGETTVFTALDSPLKCINCKRVGVIFSCVSEHTALSWKYSRSLNMKQYIVLQYITFTGKTSWLDFFCFLYWINLAWLTEAKWRREGLQLLDEASAFLVFWHGTMGPRANQQTNKTGHQFQRIFTRQETGTCISLVGETQHCESNAFTERTDVPYCIPKVQ